VYISFKRSAWYKKETLSTFSPFMAQYSHLAISTKKNYMLHQEPIVATDIRKKGGNRVINSSMLSNARQRSGTKRKHCLLLGSWYSNHHLTTLSGNEKMVP